MTVGMPHRVDCIFRVRETSEGWSASRDQVLYGEFQTRGDAVRGACFGARGADRHGSCCQVLTEPGDRRVSHYEPHFDD